MTCAKILAFNRLYPHCQAVEVKGVSFLSQEFRQMVQFYAWIAAVVITVAPVLPLSILLTLAMKTEISIANFVTHEMI